MLVLTRKLNETICLGETIRITVIDVKGNKVRLGIEAPHEISIRRGELPARASFAFDDAPLDVGCRPVPCIAR